MHVPKIIEMYIWYRNGAMTADTRHLNPGSTEWSDRWLSISECLGFESMPSVQYGSSPVSATCFQHQAVRYTSTDKRLATWWSTSQGLIVKPAFEKQLAADPDHKAFLENQVRATAALLQLQRRILTVP